MQFNFNSLSGAPRELSLGLGFWPMLWVNMFVFASETITCVKRYALGAYVITDAALDAGLSLVWGQWFGLLDVPAACYNRFLAVGSYLGRGVCGMHNHPYIRLRGLPWRVAAGEPLALHRHLIGGQLPIFIPFVGLGCAATMFMLECLIMSQTHSLGLWLMQLIGQMMLVAITFALLVFLNNEQERTERQFERCEAWFRLASQDARMRCMRDILARANRWNRVERHRANRWSCSVHRHRQALAQAHEDYRRVLVTAGDLLVANLSFEAVGDGTLYASPAVDHFDGIVMPMIRQLTACDEEINQLHKLAFPPGPRWPLHLVHGLRTWWQDRREDFQAIVQPSETARVA